MLTLSRLHCNWCLRYFIVGWYFDGGCYSIQENKVICRCWQSECCVNLYCTSLLINFGTKFVIRILLLILIADDIVIFIDFLLFCRLSLPRVCLIVFGRGIGRNLLQNRHFDFPFTSFHILNPSFPQWLFLFFPFNTSLVALMFILLPQALPLTIFLLRLTSSPWSFSPG